VIDSLRKYLSKLNLKQLQEMVKKKFAYFAELLENGDLDELKNSYNEAYFKDDLVTQSQAWSVFDLLQKKLKILQKPIAFVSLYWSSTV
jgi:hypothetical protein